MTDSIIKKNLINFSVILYILGIVLIFFSLSMVFSLCWAFYFNEKELVFTFLKVIALTFLCGFILWRFNKKPAEELKTREGFSIVALCWILITIFGSLPYYISGEIPSFIDAIFETISGLTTTGATILSDIESLSYGLLFWRSFTHWLGGMGIILLSLAILPLLGVGGMQLYKAEVPGPTKDKLTPRLKDTAKILWQVYFFITIIQAIILQLAGMTFFDALCHSFGAIASGGFSTKNASLAYYNSPLIEYLITVFMYLAGINFALHFKALSTKKFFVFWKDKEYLFYFKMTTCVTILATVKLYLSGNYFSLEEAFRKAIFNVVSVMSTTGYATDDYEFWPYLIQSLLFISMFIGGCSGSTAGGLKIIRVHLLLKHLKENIKKIIHPQMVTVIRYGDSIIQPSIMMSVLTYLLVLICVYLTSAVLLTSLDLDLLTAFTAPITCLSSVGPGFGTIGPAENYSHLPILAKYILCSCMLFGRLEIYTLIILFSKTFWKI